VALSPQLRAVVRAVLELGFDSARSRYWGCGRAARRANTPYPSQLRTKSQLKGSWHRDLKHLLLLNGVKLLRDSESVEIPIIRIESS